MEEHELRMYFFVPYNISPIQQAIQAGHAMGEYALKFGRHNPDHTIWTFLEKWKTWIVLNGGTTNSQRDFKMIPAGSLNQIGDQLQENGIEFTGFHEPDLQNALTALCFIADERVWDYEKVPDWNDYQEEYYKEADGVTDMDYEELRHGWELRMGNEKNIFLRELLRDKRLA